MEIILQYWNLQMIQINLIIVLNLIGAMTLGLIVGYERSYHGRAAGMRTYGMVCVASCALTIFAGYPHYWFGEHYAGTSFVDPTRVIQGIVTGIGFLGAGMIMKDGMSISGLTTAASIWSSSAIGILVGVGFYAAAICLTILSAGLMMWGGKLESKLPLQPAIALKIRFKAGVPGPDKNKMRLFAAERGYSVAEGSFTITYESECLEWNFVAVAIKGFQSECIKDLSEELRTMEIIDKFQISHARN